MLHNINLFRVYCVTLQYEVPETESCQQDLRYVVNMTLQGLVLSSLT